MRITRGKLVAGGAVVAVVAAAAWAFRPRPIDVEVAAAARESMRVTVDAEGRTRVRDRYVVAAPVAGRVRRIALEEGELVSPGQVVAWIAPLPLDEQGRRLGEAKLSSALAMEREAQARLAQARVAEVHAGRTARRYEALLDAGGISPQERDQVVLAHRSSADELAAAEARARAAVAEVQAARTALLSLDGGRTAIPVRSPCEGSVLRVPERSERVVAAGMPLLELGNAHALEVLADVLSADAVRLAPGDRADVVEWGGDSALAGRVRSVEPSAFTRVSALGVDEQRVNVRIDIAGAPRSLGDGYRVEVRMTVWERPDALTIPASALFRRGDEWTVYVAARGRARLRPVRIGQRTAARAEILEGLAAGERVVLFPSDELTDGARIRTA